MPSCGLPAGGGCPRRPGWSFRRSGRISFADQASLRVRVGRVAPEVEAVGQAVRLGLVPPAVQERADDAVVAAPVDLAGRAAGDDSVEDGLHLVGGRVPGCPQPVGRERVADLAPVVLRLPAAAVDDLGAEHVAAERGVLVGLLPAKAMVHVERGDLVAELSQHVPEAGGVGSARDEASHAAPAVISSCSRMSSSTAYESARVHHRRSMRMCGCRRGRSGRCRLGACRSSRRGGSRPRSPGGRTGTPSASPRAGAGRGR